MKIAVACDHGAYEYKEMIKEMLLSQGHEVVDFGTDSTASMDYPDTALPTRSKASAVPCAAIR